MLHLTVSLPLVLADSIEAPTRFGGSTGPDLTRYFIVCAILVVVTGLVAWGLRRLLSGNLRVRAAKRSLQTLDVLPLGGKRKLAVVRCYDRTFVLGLGDHEITPIAELDAVETASEQPAPATRANDAAFAAALEAVRRSMPEKRVAEVRAPLPSARPVVAEPEAPRKRVVRRKVKKSAARKPAAPRRPAKKATKSAARSEAMSVAAAAQEIARDKQRVRQEQERRTTTAAGASAAAPAVAAEPARPQRLRLEGVLG